MASQLHSPRKMISRVNEETAPTQVVDFTSFRKKNSEIVSDCKETSLTVKRNVISLPVVLAGLSLIYNRDNLNQAVFKQLHSINVTKLYTNYMNDKTLMQFLEIIKTKIKSIDTLGDILNHYPLAAFILDLYARQSGILSIQNYHKKDDLLGNQFEILNDMNSELRGISLDLIVQALKLNLNFKFIRSDSQKFVRKSNLQEIQQNYGPQDYCALIQIKFIGNINTYSVIEDRSESPSKMRKSRMQLFQRKSRTRQTDLSKVTIQSKSMNKDQVCKSCSYLICQCQPNKQQRQPITSRRGPKLNKSISGGFMNYNEAVGLQGLSMGFIDVNKIINRQNYSRNDDKQKACRCKQLKKICRCNNETK